MIIKWNWSCSHLRGLQECEGRGITESWRKDCEIYLGYIHVLHKCVLPCRSSLELMWYDSLGIRKWGCSFIAWLCFVFLQDKQYFMFSLHLPSHKYFLNTVTYFITCTLIWHINVNSCLKQPHESLASTEFLCSRTQPFDVSR